MQYISLDDAIHAIAARIGLPEFLGDETRTYERAGVVVEFEQDYLYACRYSFAAAVLHQCITNSALPLRWWSMHPDTGMAVIGDSVDEEGLAILLRFARLIRREQDSASNHHLFARADGPFLGEDGLPRRKPRTIDTTELFSEMGGLYWFQSIGLVTSDLVQLLDEERVGHNLSPQAPPVVTVTAESAPAQDAVTHAPVVTDEIDFTMVATRKDLIDAFGKFTEMNMTWFDNLTDTPKLKAARKFTGQGGRHSAEPLFCPYEVMQWLADPKRKKGKPLSETTAWRLLKGNFGKVYNQYSIGDPNAD